MAREPRAAFLANEEMLALLLDGVAEHAIYLLDPQGRIASWNTGAARIKGYSAEEVLGKSIAMFYVPEDVARGLPAHALREAAAHGRFEVEGQRVRKNGTRFWAHVTIFPLYDEKRELLGFAKVLQDISERKNAEKAMEESLRASEEARKELADFKYAIDQHAIVATTDVKGRITYVNDRFCQISKYSRAELLGQDHRIINSGHHPKKFFRELYRTIAHGETWHAEICNRAKDGSLYWVDTTVVPLLTVEGKPRQYIAMRTDITTRKRAEEELAEQSTKMEERVIQRTAQLEAANRELEAFTYSVSHDLRAPLRHIAGFSGILLEEFRAELKPDAQRYLERILEGTRRMGQLVDEMLNLARVGRYQLKAQRTDLNAIVGELMPILQPECQGRIVEWRIERMAPAQCDPVLLKQVLQNLLSNAIKFTRKQEHAVITVGEVQCGLETAIFVRDNGVGFDMKYADKLFGVFQRLHRAEEFEGTGVGLATVQRIVQKHGGRVWAESMPGQGATFYFTLSTAARAAALNEGFTTIGASS